MYKYYLFDLDGTISQSEPGILNCIRYALDAAGLPEPSEKVLKTFIGPPIQDSFAKAYNLSGDILQDIATCFRNRYKDYELLKAVPYDGIYEVFDKLMERNVKLAVATYKRQDYAEAILKHFGFDKYTNILYGADHNNKLKKVDIIEKCMVDLGVTDYSNAVMIGDSSHDAIGAEKIGMDFIGVTYGFDFRAPEDVYKFKAVGAAAMPLDLLNLI